MTNGQFVLKQRLIHMLPGDSAIWIRWLQANEQGWTDYEYDVHVGEGVPVTGDYPNWGVALAKLLTQKRIDVMAYRQGVPWIFEIKPQAGLSAYGQLLAYRELYLRDHPEVSRVELAVVTDILNPDERFVYDMAGIKVFVV
jgi:hypothetical protein